MRHAFLKATGITTFAAIALAGCSEASEDQAYETAEIASDSAASDAAANESAAEEAEFDQGQSVTPNGVAAQTNALPDIPVAMPKIAYLYDYSFEMPGEDIADLQKTHADLCEAQGPFTCRIISMSHSGDADSDTSGRLQLAVAAPQARSFGDKLNSATTDAGGEQVNAAISGEDLSKKIVDTDARLKARTVLRDRLLEVLRTRRGSVSELVEAERSVARVNEEIDQAKGWLAEMRARVAFSRVDIRYQSSSAASGDFISPINSALGSIGTISGTVLAGIIMLLAILLPLGAAGYAAMWLRRRFTAPAMEIAAEA